MFEVESLAGLGSPGQASEDRVNERGDVKGWAGARSLETSQPSWISSRVHGEATQVLLLEMM